jgi:hypothetical protein
LRRSGRRTVRWRRTWPTARYLWSTPEQMEQSKWET